MIMVRLIVVVAICLSGVVTAYGETSGSSLETTVVESPSSQIAGNAGADLPAIPQRLLWHVGDPSYTRKLVAKRISDETNRGEQQYYQSLLKRLDLIDRPEKMALSLQEALQRTVKNSLAIRIASYNPAIETTRLIEAEAAFDATFFSTLTKNKQNRPVASALIGSSVDTFDLTSGIAKMLPTGLQASTSLNLRRMYTDFQYQDINPEYSSAFVVELRQPVLRGFGIDYNRSFIRIGKLDRQISDHSFRRQVIRTLVDAEEAYWTLVRARREVVISGRLLSRFERIYDYLWQRREFDAYAIQIADTKARLAQSRANFLQVLANVRNAEDSLINLMNDREIDLADEIEIIPVDFPSQSPVVIDRLSEVQIALNHRPELTEAKLTLKKLEVAVGQAKNQALPKFDTTFRYTVDGLSESMHDAFSEVTKNDFHEYYVGLEFELPIGNRAREAVLARARLQHAQTMATLKKALEDVILDVNLQARNLETSYKQIRPNFESVEANEAQVEAIVARAETKSFVQLNQELNALQALASSRRGLLKSLVDYNMAIVELERAKGTLPAYNNIILETEEP